MLKRICARVGFIFLLCGTLIGGFVLPAQAVDTPAQCEIRSISLEYIDTLSSDSKWGKDPLKEDLLSVLSNDLTDTSACQQVWEFTASDYKTVRDWCREREKGTQTNVDFINNFYNKNCIIDNTDQ